MLGLIAHQAVKYEITVDLINKAIAIKPDNSTSLVTCCKQNNTNLGKTQKTFTCFTRTGMKNMLRILMAFGMSS